MKLLRHAGICAVLALALAVSSASPAVAPAPALHFTTFAATGLPLGQVVWTGREFLYAQENVGQIMASDAAGKNLREFAAFDLGGEEMRCLPSPAKPRYWPAGIYCHTPDNRILRMAIDGSGVKEFARLPVSASPSDGALAFDTVGRFGYALLAATGGSISEGGEVFAIRRDGSVQPIGAYPGPGGADNIEIAPVKFGSASGLLLIAIDQDHAEGRVLAIDRKGSVQPIARGLGNGLNPIMVIEPTPAKRAAGAPPAGFYMADTVSQNVFFAPAAPERRFAGAVVVATELTGEFWIIRPKASGRGFQVLVLKTDLPAVPYNFEGSDFVP